MTQINELSTGTLSSGDLIPVFSVANSDSRKATLAALATFLAPTAATRVTQYAAPNATGFTIQVVNPGQSVYLLITPTAGFAAGTIVLPDPTQNVDKQSLIVTTTQAITALTVTGGAVNPVPVNGAPTTLAANGFFDLRYDTVLKSWYRVG